MLIRWRCQTMLNSLRHKHLTLQKQWSNVWWKGFHWPEVGHTTTCLVYMSWCKEVWNHLTHSPQVKWPIRMKTIFMRVCSSLPITLLYQFWWICQSALHPAPHKFRHHSYVNLVVVSQWAPKCSHILTNVLPDSILYTPPKAANIVTYHWRSWLCVNLPIVGAQCWTPLE